VISLNTKITMFHNPYEFYHKV